MARQPVRPVVGFVAGALIAYVDNFAFEGEVSPIVIVAMLLVATGIAGVLWGRQAWVASSAIWACIPLVHLMKHFLRLPDTLQPNTYASIVALAVFTLVVSSVGTGGGVLLRWLSGKGNRDGGS
jgi:hypothetical protein